MSRVQLALNVTDLDAAVAFYSDLFGTAPHKRRDGYANFAVEEPPLKLVLIESAEAAGGTLNHLGIEVGSTEEVAAAVSRLSVAGLATDVRDAELCCHAVQDKVWVADPDGAPWEVYTILDDAPADAAVLPMAGATAGGCCSSDETSVCCTPA
ncbi:MAG: VOC family protein [Actinobacteria bacterium]|nr:VOC family protein [Actinomycetota bacterium]